MVAAKRNNIIRGHNYDKGRYHSYALLRLRIESPMMDATTTRWTVSVSRDTDIEVRSFLAQRGMKKGDLSNSSRRRSGSVCSIRP